MAKASSLAACLMVMIWTFTAVWGKKIPEYGPDIPTEDIVFQGTPVFLAKVMMPKAQAGYETVLSIKIEVPVNRITSFEAFVNLPNADEHTSLTKPEFVGSFIELMGSGSEFVQRTVRFGIGDKCDQFNLYDHSSIMVTLVRPGFRDSPIIVKDMSIELEALDE